MQTVELDYKTLSDRFKLLAHPERLRILDALRREPECVCHLEALLDKPQPYVSQQLRFLRASGVIMDEKRGQHVFYRLNDDEIARWLDLLLGVADGPHPELAAYKKVISCGCPNCVQGPNPARPEMTIAEK